jgi:hypothetical protein
MAIRIKKGELGEISGKVGNTVLSSWKHIDVVKSTPHKRLRNPEKSPTTQNVRIGLMSNFLSRFSKCLKVGFYTKNGKIPGYQAALKYNLLHAIAEKQLPCEIDFSKVLMSKGTREMPWACRLSAVDAFTIKVSWEIPQTAKLASIGKDDAYVLCYNSTTGRGGYMVFKAKRSSLSLTEVLHYWFHVGTVHFWLYFMSPDGKEASNSKYLGELDLSKVV